MNRTRSKSGRSKFRPSDNVLGKMIRAARKDLKLGLIDVAEVCGCSVQFISNIEHGRAPLPWEKVACIAKTLRLDLEKLQAANLAIRSEFKSFVGKKRGSQETASILALASHDADLRDMLARYQSASPDSRKAFREAALRLL